MCRRNQLLAIAAIALGAGFLLCVLISSPALAVIFGLMLVATGCMLSKKY